MIAYNLSEIFNLEIERQKLSDLIKESAERIKERQDTDTIELVDDVRYYLTKKYAINEEIGSFDPTFHQTRIQMISIYTKLHCFSMKGR